MTKKELQIRAGVVGKSKAINDLLDIVIQVAPSDVTVLLQGESGVGKEVFARAVHMASKRSNKRLVSVNCGAIPETLLESELFGHVKGSFTGAIRDKEGLFKVGDAIEKATVKKILRGKVILRVGNRDEVLSMKEPTSSEQGKAPGIVNPSRPEGGRTITISRSELERSIQNINSLLSQARVRPSFNRGKPNGLVVDQIRANSFFSKLGLRNGDIVNRVNGRLIRSPADIIFVAHQTIFAGSI